MLIGNYSVLCKLPIRWRGGSASSPETTARSGFNTNGAMRNRLYVDKTTATIETYAIPSATYPPYAWMLPQIPGEMSSRQQAALSVSTAATITPGMPGEGSATISIVTNTPAGELIVSGSGSASMSVTVGSSLLTASINGSGGASMSISTNMPILGAIAGMTATSTISIVGSLQSYAVGFMSGTTVDTTTITNDSVANAVWESLLTQHQTTGSAGKALASASSGGVDLGLMAQAVWGYVSRTLTETPGITVDEVIAGLQATTIPTNISKVNNVPVQGSGTKDDPWRPV